jgi:hypothetical protein
VHHKYTARDFPSFTEFLITWKSFFIIVYLSKVASYEKIRHTLGHKGIHFHHSKLYDRLLRIVSFPSIWACTTNNKSNNIRVPTIRRLSHTGELGSYPVGPSHKRLDAGFVWRERGKKMPSFIKQKMGSFVSVLLKGQSHKKVGEMSVWGISLGPN